MHIVVIAHIVGSISLPDSLEKPRHRFLSDLWHKLETSVQEALRHRHKRSFPCVAFRQRKNVKVQVTDVHEFQL